MPTFQVIRADATIEYVNADWCKYQPTTGWTFERLALAPGEPGRAVVRRFRGTGSSWSPTSTSPREGCGGAPPGVPAPRINSQENPPSRHVPCSRHEAGHLSYLVDLANIVICVRLWQRC